MATENEVPIVHREKYGIIGNITETMLRQETISSLKVLRRMINTSIRWKKHHEEGEI